MRNKLNEDQLLANSSVIVIPNISSIVHSDLDVENISSIVHSELVVGENGNVVLIAGAGTVAVLVLIAFAAHWIQASWIYLIYSFQNPFDFEAFETLGTKEDIYGGTVINVGNVRKVENVRNVENV